MPTKNTPSEPKATSQDFPIVGIGASAGGLEAFKEFLKAIPEKSGMAYVLVQHLDPTHDSILTEILSQVTKIPINEVTDDIHLAPDRIYVIPENKMLTSIDGVLKLSPRDNKTKNRAIDIFFISLASVHLNLAVGVVLSGKGSDGTLGLKAIKEHGGITFAQDADAQYKEMPQSAIQANTVDFILDASKIPEKLLEIEREKQNPTIEDNESTFQEIINLLRQHSGVDFTYYKQTTVRRRIARRMDINKNSTLLGYLKLLQGDKFALSTLFNDLLIPVTGFFRDPNIFKTIREVVFPALIKRKSETNSIRIWVAGCSTGEEAYTLAILLHEFLGENLTGTQIQIFASDISEPAIAKARIGFYTNAQLLPISESLLKKYFTKTNTGYNIKRQIRDLCIFATHNFLKDPPFAKMDLITCRNVLIYMDSFLQKKALTTFHYALKEDGFLLLGKSETTAPAEELFLSLAKSEKIYTRKKATTRFAYSTMKERSLRKEENRAPVEVSKTDFKKSAESILLAKYTPASVVVNEQMDIVHIHGLITDFLEISPGKPSFNLLKMAKEGLAFELRNAWHKSKETQGLIVKEDITVKNRGITIQVSLEIQPLLDTVEPYFLILFYKTLLKKEEGPNSNFSSKEILDDNNLKRISQLEKELAQTHEDVNAIAEEQEASNEELQSANEELLSGSEELQSLNEELETSKEELQSSNEELIIINQELLNKQQQINISRNYTEAIVATLREPIVVLDINLRIKNINRAFSKKYSIAKEEAEGKLIYEIQNHLFDNMPMRSVLEKVLIQNEQLDDYETSVTLHPHGESILLLNARQLTNEASNEHLLLLAIEDITERRNIEKRLQILSDGFEASVFERTGALLTSNTDLEISIKELHEANIQLQQFAYIASHDLQEPLRKILMFTDKLLHLDKRLPDEAITVLDKISKSSDRMKNLIQDLLAYSYLDKHENLFVAIDLNNVIKNILTDFELLIEQKNVVITINNMPTIDAIPLQMNQLFYNLISNAIKFNKGNGVLPTINIKSQKLTLKQLKKHDELDQTLSYHEIIIKDNGIGFDKKYENKIFTIFQRLHNNEVYNGTGIGLAISKKIIENHKGIIFSKSKENEGASFHVILPIKSKVS